MRALVTGATGMIGPSLVNQLLVENWNVRIMVRNAFAPTLFTSAVERFSGDIVDFDSLRTAMNGVDVVFHLAAKLHLNTPSPSLAQEYRRINVAGATNVARAALDAGVKRMVHFSTISVYGPSLGRDPYTESSPLNPQSLYAETKCQSEEGIRKIFHDSALSSFVILRLGAVYGPRLQGNYRTLVKAIRHGLFLPVGDGQNRRTMIYIDDLVQAAILAAEHPGAANAVFNVTDGQIHTLNEVVAAIAHALDKRPSHLRLPGRPVQAIAGFADRFTEKLHLPAPKLRLLVDKVMEDVAARGDTLCRHLAFRPQHDLMLGWQAALGTGNYRNM